MRGYTVNGHWSLGEKREEGPYQMCDVCIVTLISDLFII